MNQIQNAASMGSSMKGRALLLKLYQSLNFYDSQLKKVVNENMNLMSYIEQKGLVHAEEDQQERTTDETNLK